jgi:hypothetical protein
MVSLIAGCFHSGRHGYSVRKAHRDSLVGLCGREGLRAPFFVGTARLRRVIDMALITSLAMTCRNSNRHFALEISEPTCSSQQRRSKR